LIFLDTSFLAAYFNATDIHHEEASETAKQIAEGRHGVAYTSDYVFDELVTVMLSRAKSIRRAAAAGQHILHSDMVMERVDGQTFKEAWNLFRKLGKLSFTDCTSLVLMRKRRIRNIATYDKELLDRAKAI